MEDNNKRNNDGKKVKFRTNILGSKKNASWWLFIIIIATFIISAVFSLLSSSILEKSNYIISSIVVIIIIIIHIAFDIVGTAVTAADETPFHAMASRKLYGAKQSIKLIRNADKVSNLCNDVVGDICGIISGAASTYIIIEIVKTGLSPQTSILGLSITGLVASLTVGGKSIGKTIAIKNSNYIIYKVAVIIQFFIKRFKFKKSIKKKK
jgi:CBS domain containing-hemolysin-like protein